MISTSANRLWFLFVPLLGLALGAALAAVPRLPANWLPPVLLLLVLPAVVALVPNVPRFLCALLLLETAIPLDIFLGFRQDAADVSALPGLPISLTTLVLGVAYLHWTLSRLARTAPRDLGLGAAVAPLAVYVVAVLISWFGALDTQLATFEVGLLVQLLLLFTYICHVIRTEADLWFMGRVVVAVLAIEALIMAGLVAVGRSVVVGPFLARIDTEPFFRVAGTVGSPNAAGAFLVLLMLPTLARWRVAETRAGRVVAAATFALALGMLLLTLSRGAWLGFAIGSVLFVVVASARGWLPRRFLAALVLVGATALVLLADPVSHRLRGDDASPFSDRVALMNVAVRMFTDQPALGVGPNGFSAALPDYLNARFAGGFVSVVHNKYLLIAAETGVLGLLTFLAFLSLTLARGWRAVARLRGRSAMLVLGIFAGVVGVGAHMFFDLFHGRTDTQVLIFMCALLTAAWRISRRGDGSPPSADDFLWRGAEGPSPETGSDAGP